MKIKLNNKKCAMLIGAVLILESSTYVLHAERQVKVWSLINTISISNEQTQFNIAAPNDMANDTGISKIGVFYDGYPNTYPDRAHVTYMDAFNDNIEMPLLTDNEAFEDTIAAPAFLTNCFLITNRNQSKFELKRHIIGKEVHVDLIDALKKHIKDEQSRFAGLSSNVLAGGAGGSHFLHKMSELQLDFEALNSISAINDPAGVVVVPERETIILCYDTKTIAMYDPGSHAYLPQRFAVLKFSMPLFNNLWKLIE
jgi:hypothetical protein